MKNRREPLKENIKNNLEIYAISCIPVFPLSLSVNILLYLNAEYGFTGGISNCILLISGVLLLSCLAIFRYSLKAYIRQKSEKYRKMADMLEIGHRIEYYPGELSGGEKQRAAIGRALINGPSLVLADEPTGNLDSVSSKMVMDLLVRLQRELNVTMIVVTHDKEVANFCDRIIRMIDGQICK